MSDMKGKKDQETKSSKKTKKQHEIKFRKQG